MNEKVVTEILEFHANLKKLVKPITKSFLYSKNPVIQEWVNGHIYPLLDENLNEIKLKSHLTDLLNDFGVGLLGRVWMDLKKINWD